jgi:hypothetical protein
MPDNSGHESDGRPADPPDVGLAIVAKMLRLPLYVVRSRSRYGLEKRSVATSADVSIVYATDASKPRYRRDPGPSRCRVVNHASALPRRDTTGSILDLSAVSIAISHGVEKLHTIGTAVD